jgi:hypothetical protein
MVLERAIGALSLKPVDKIPLLGLPGGGLVETYGVNREDNLTAYRFFDVDLIYVEGIKENVGKGIAKEYCGFFRDFEDSFPATDIFPVAYRGLKLARTESATQLWVIERPFRNYSELVTYLKRDFDPLSWEERSKRELEDNYAYTYRRMQEPLKDVTLVAGEIYLTLFTFFIIHLGHKMVLLLLRRNPELFLEAAEKYVEVSRMHMEAWRNTGIRAFVSHDDIALRDGPMMSPTTFGEYVAPFYREIWRPLREDGIKILFISDGSYLQLMDHILAQGAGGFKLNWDARLSRDQIRWLFLKYGGRQVLSFGPSESVLTWGSMRESEEEAAFLSELAARTPGFFLSNVEGEANRVKGFWDVWRANSTIGSPG